MNFTHLHQMSVESQIPKPAVNAGEHLCVLLCVLCVLCVLLCCCVVVVVVLLVIVVDVFCPCLTSAKIHNS